jgi:hypothetical protein
MQTTGANQEEEMTETIAAKGVATAAKNILAVLVVAAMPDCL